MSDQILSNDRRVPARAPLDGDVVIEVAGSQLVGPGRDISKDGVFFVSEGVLPVKVRVPGQDEPVDGELVRVEAMGGGKLGIAVRFVPPSTLG